jgi:hypothetical protein
LCQVPSGRLVAQTMTEISLEWSKPRAPVQVPTYTVRHPRWARHLRSAWSGTGSPTHRTMGACRKPVRCGVVRRTGSPGVPQRDVKEL